MRISTNRIARLTLSTSRQFMLFISRGIWTNDQDDPMRRTWIIILILPLFGVLACISCRPNHVFVTGYVSGFRPPSRIIRSVDVSFNKDRLTGTYTFPGDVKFNTCKTQPGTTDNFGAYELAIHEAGHALGSSGFSFDLLESLTTSRRTIQAHPTIPDSVMNYDNRRGEIKYLLPGNFNEPDCSPHPFDIMAIYALYQSVGAN